MEKKYHTVKTLPKCNRKMAEAEVKSKPLTHMFMITHFPGLVQDLQ